MRKLKYCKLKAEKNTKYRVNIQLNITHLYVFLFTSVVSIAHSNSNVVADSGVPRLIRQKHSRYNKGKKKGHRVINKYLAENSMFSFEYVQIKVPG